MNKLLLTRLRGKLTAALAAENRICQLELEPRAEADALGAIYIGKVKNIVKNINAAFVEYQDGVNGYYSLTENRTHLYADGKEHPALHEGDEILVQVERAAVKTKDAVLTSALSLPGRYAVLTFGGGKNGTIGISAKIRDTAWRARIKDEWESRSVLDYGLIVRTNAFTAEEEALKKEAAVLEKRFREIMESSSHRTCKSCLYRPDSFPVQAVKNCSASEIGEIVTDLPEVFEEISAYLSEISPERLGMLRLYDDAMLSLPSLYSLERALTEATGKRVWLKSGGYLIIEPTEAMTVIDVNTGKTVGKKQAAETIFETNLEAAAEIAFQLKLRNLSGIILVDFIDMEREEQKEQLMKKLREETSRDQIRTSVVDMTALGLVEMTRKKVKKPLSEQIQS